jgi:hypothetical protein
VNELSNSSFGVFVSPLEGESRFIVMANVAHDFAMEVGLGFEDATCNKIPLDFGEPDLDLIEPRGVGGGVMELDVGVGAQEALDRFSLMSREVVGNNMNLSVGGLSGDHLAQELYKLSTGMAVGCLAQDFAGGRVQGRIEGKSAVAKVFESVTFGAPRRERQDGVETVKGLDGALFIDTENSCMGRRLQVETDDSGRLLLKLWVIADHVVATPVRLQPPLSPHPGHTHMVDPERKTQLAAAPMSGTIGGLAVQSPIDDPSFKLLDSLAECTSTVPTPESGQTLFFKAVPPHAHCIDTATLCRLRAQRLTEPEAKLRIILARRASSARRLRLRLMR